MQQRSDPSKPFALALALVCGIGASDARAVASTSHASISNVQITVTDLDQFDGIDAGFDFFDPKTSLLARHEQVAEQLKVLPGWNAIEQVRFESSLVVGEARGGVGSLSAEVAAERGSSPPTLFATSVTQWFDLGFSLRPNTRLDVSGEASVALSMDPACAAVFHCNGSRSEVGIAFNAPGVQSVLSVRYDNSDPDPARSMLEQSRIETLNWSFSSGADAVAGDSFSVSAFSRANGPPIPEPEAYALMLLGLAAIAARRRTHRVIERPDN